MGVSPLSRSCEKNVFEPASRKSSKGDVGMKIPDIIGGLWPEIEFNKIMPVVMAVSRESSPPLIAGVIETLGQIYQSDLALGLLSTTPRDIFEHQLTAAGVKLELFEKLLAEAIPVLENQTRKF